MEERFKELKDPIIPAKNPEPAQRKVPIRLTDKVWCLNLC